LGGGDFERVLLECEVQDEEEEEELGEKIKGWFQKVDNIEWTAKK
jgi:hypothetical protein